jgi:hypothetical protein
MKYLTHNITAGLGCIALLLVVGFSMAVAAQFAAAQGATVAGQTGNINTSGSSFTNDNTGRTHSVQSTSAQAQSAANAIASATGGYGSTYRLVDTSTGRTLGYISVTRPRIVATSNATENDVTYNIYVRNSSSGGWRGISYSGGAPHDGGTLTIGPTDRFDLRFSGKRSCTAVDFDTQGQLATNGQLNNLGNDYVAPGETRTFTLVCRHKSTGAGTVSVRKLSDISTDLSVRTTGNPVWQNDAGVTNLTINYADLPEIVDLQWTSTGAADMCTGRNFSTGAASPANGTATGIILPTPGTSLTYDVTCTTPSGSIAVDSVTISVTDPPPTPPTNLTVQGFTVISTTGFDAITGIYDAVTISGTVRNVGVDSTVPSQYELTLNTTGESFTDWTPGLSFGTAAPTSAVFSNVRFGSLSLTLEADTANAVAESNEGDNSITNSVTLFPPTPNMTLTTPQEIIRSGTAVISWNTDASYPMDCTVAGAGITPITFDPSTDGPTGDVTTAVLTSTGLYELRCTEPLTGSVFVETLNIEVIGSVQEI